MVSSTMRETISRAFCLSSAGTTYQGACARAGGCEALLVRLHVLLPVLALFDVRFAELPVLLGRIDAREKALALFLLREVQEEFDDAGAVAVEMTLEAEDRPVALRPDGLVAALRPNPAGSRRAESPGARAR